MSPYPKYRACAAPVIADRAWPTRRITASPTWCAVDLRDGNQAFVRPMDIETKIRYFRMLAAIGFKEIEIGYPSASQTEFEFVRRIIGEGMAPADVEVSVFTAARRDLIERTFEAIAGIERGIVHCYVATSELHRSFVFGKSRDEMIRLAVDGTRMIAEAAERHGVRDRIRYEFSPEEFSDTEVDFAVEIAAAVKSAWGRTDKRGFILNLPETVERRAPYEYADMIEAFVRAYPYMDETTLSVHTHNDQGGAVAAAEMAILAGAERVEGTLAGHGERTGNMDLVTMALNFQSRGIATGLDFRDLPAVTAFIEEVSGIGTDPRHPYTGELVFTAFSGTHQDAIRKGLSRRGEIAEHFHQGWKIPYLQIDPADIGRDYDGLIRINSQSGKGGVAYVLENVYGIVVPKAMQPEVARAVQLRAEAAGGEILPSEVRDIFRGEFVDAAGPLAVADFRLQRPADEDPESTRVELSVTVDGDERRVSGIGPGPIAAARAALRMHPGVPEFQIQEYSEHALERGADAMAMAFIGVTVNGGDRIVYGAGVDANVNLAAIKAIRTALNRALV